jgi:hypothetical protein
MAARDAVDPDGKGQVSLAILPNRKIVGIGGNLPSTKSTGNGLMPSDSAEPHTGQALMPSCWSD